MKLTDKRFWKFEAMMLLCGVLTLLFVFCSCSNRHDLTDNYSVFTYGDGLYGESERDYPIFVEQNNNYWWIITAADSRLSYGDRYVGPLSEQRKDSIIHAEKISIKQMEHRNYE